MTDDDAVKIIFESDIYALKEGTDEVKDSLEDFKDKAEENLDLVQDKMAETGAAAQDMAAEHQEAFTGIASHGIHSFTMLSRAVAISSRVFGEHGNEATKMAMELTHVSHSATMLIHGTQMLTGAMQHLTVANIAMVASNPYAIAGAAAIAAGLAVWKFSTATTEAGEEAEKAGKKFEKMWAFKDGRLTQTNEKEEEKKEVAAIQARLNKALEERKAVQEKEDNPGFWAKLKQSTDSEIREAAAKKERVEADKKVNEAKKELHAAENKEIDEFNKTQHEAMEAHNIFMEKMHEDTHDGAIRASAKAIADHKGSTEAEREYNKERQAEDIKLEETNARKLQKLIKDTAYEEVLIGASARTKAIVKAVRELGEDATEPAKAAAREIAIKQDNLKIEEELANKAKDIAEQRREADMGTALEAEKAAKLYAATKSHQGDLSKEQLAEYKKQLKEAEEIDFSKYLRESNVELDEQQKALSLTTYEAKIYREQQALLKKLKLETGSEEAEQALQQLGIKQYLEQQQAVKTTLEQLEDEERQLHMSAAAYKDYMEAKKLGLEAGSQEMTKLRDKEMDIEAEKLREGLRPAGQKAFEDELDKISRLRDANKISRDEAALDMKKAEQAFLHQDYHATISSVDSTWNRINEAMSGDVNPQVKATRDIANKIEDRVLGKDVHKKLLEAIPEAIKNLSIQSR